MTMEVACPQCNAKYQFDASAIPEQGYDAQCTGCGGVFFVAPEKPADEQISVSCTSCGAVYQFPASAIPAEGYDAQCTQCQQVFFVSTTGGAQATAEQPAEQPVAPVEQPVAPVEQPVAPVEQPVAPVEQPVAPVEQPTAPLALEQPVPAPLPEEPTPLTDRKTTPEEPVALETPKQPSAPAETATEPPESADAEDAHDMMALSDELGEPEASPDGVSLEEDFGTIITRRRKRRMIILAVLAAVVAYSLVTYFFVPRLFDLTAGQVLRIKLTVAPEAIPPANEGLARMLDDTDAAYGAAIEKLDAALAIDDRYPDAIAYKGLALVFRGSDVQARGRAIRDGGQDALNELKALEELPKNRRPRDLEQRTAALRKKATVAAKESASLFEAGGKTVREGFALLRAGLKEYESVPLVVEAAGIYYTTDSDSLPRAGVLMRHSLQLRLGPDAVLDLSAPPNAWLPYLQALVKSTERKGKGAEDARAAFAAAIAKEPRFERARYELALFEEKQGDNDRAKQLAAEILAKVPDHAKAKALVARLTRVATPPTETKPAPAKGKKRKRKRR